VTVALQAQSNDWMVFVDGVQVPFIGFSTVVGVDQPMSGTLTLEPDALVLRIRPGAVIALFFRERYPEVGAAPRALTQQWFYYGGGEVLSVQDQRGPKTRSMSLSFASDFTYLQRHAAFASTLGGAQAFPTVVSGLASGSTLIAPAGSQGGGLASPEGWFSAAILAATLGTIEDASAGAEADASRRTYRGGGAVNTEGFGARLLRLIAWLSGHNVALRTQAVRTRFAARWCALDDRLLERAVGATIAQAFANGGLGSLLAGAGSLSDVLNTVASFGGYTLCFQPAPCYPTAQPAKAERVPPLLGVFDSPELAMWRTWYRNDIIVAPSLYFAPPPPCNLVFPDMQAEKHTMRSYFEEPTRSLHVEGALGTSMVLVEDGSLYNGAPLAHPGEYWGNIVGLLQQKKGSGASSGGGTTQADLTATVSASKAPAGSAVLSSEVNLLRLLSDAELERGVLLRKVETDGEMLYTIAQAQAKELKPLVTEHGGWDQAALRAVSTSATDDFKDAPYFNYVQQWLRYKHRLAQRAYQASFTLNGHRWLAPGFPIAIFGTDVSYIGLLASVSTTVSADGAEQNGITVSQLRTLSTLSESAAAEAQAATNQAASYRAAAAALVPDAYASHDARLQRDVEVVAQAAERLEQRDAAILQVPAGSSTAAAETARLMQDYAVYAQHFDAAYARLTAQVRAYATAAYGRQREVGAVAAVEGDADLAQALASFIDFTAPAVPSAPQIVVESRTTARNAAQAAIRFNFQQVQYFRATGAVSSPPPEVVQAISSSQSLLVNAEAAVRRATAAVETEQVVAVPPPFYNPQLLIPAQADVIYQELLGCKPFYTGSSYAVPAAEEDGEYLQLLKPFSKLRTTEKPDSAAVDAAAQHEIVVQTLARVFPALRNTSAVKLPAETHTFSDWESAVSSVEGSMAWQHRQLLTRNAQSLAGYLKDHGFEGELEALISDEPSPTVFYRMRPVTTTAAPAVSFAGQSWPWDNSVVCRLVDPNELLGKEADTAVTERRAGVKTPVLSSKYRQDLVVAYSRKHFGSRALGGES